MYIVVADAFALAEIESKGESSLYFSKHLGSWKYAGEHAPETLPSSVKKKFDQIMNAKPRECTNPNFVSHPSGQ